MTAILRSDGQPSKFFALEEFACRCHGRHGTPCEEYPLPRTEPNRGIQAALVSLLEKVRVAVGGPIHLNCGYRCPAHNAAVGGVANSQHVLGGAADVTTKALSPKDLMLLVERIADPKGMGLYDGFVHLDVREGPRARWDKRVRPA